MLVSLNCNCVITEPLRTIMALQILFDLDIITLKDSLQSYITDIHT